MTRPLLPAISLALALSFTTHCFAVAPQPVPLTVLPTKLDTSALLSRTVSTRESAVLSRLQFEGEYFDYLSCRKDKFGRGNAFSVRCTEKPDQVYRVEILKNGKRHALYENVSDGGVSSDGAYLAIRNATVAGKDRVTEQVRIIDIASKAFKRLPIVPCTTNILRWSRGKLITSSNLIYDAIMPGYIEICTWDAQGKLLGRVQAGDIATATTERPINRIGFLPTEKSAIYILGGIGPQPGGQCTLRAVDLKDSSRTATVIFDPKLPALYNCSDGSLDSVELDLRNFTIDRPSLRFRIHQDVNAPNDGPVGPWKTVPAPR